MLILKRFGLFVPKEIEGRELDQMHSFVVKMQDLAVGVIKLRHAHGAFLAEADTVAKSFSYKLD